MRAEAPSKVLRKLSYPPIWLLLKQRRVQIAVGALFAVGAVLQLGGYYHQRGFPIGERADCPGPPPEFVWLHTRIKPMRMLACASAAVLSFTQRCLGSLKREWVSAAGRGTAKWPRALSSLEAFSNRGGGAFAAMSGGALASALAAGATSPAGALPLALGGSAGNGRRFRHGPGLLCGFWRGCSLSPSPTWRNVGVLWRFGQVRPAKPPRSCERGSRALRMARLDMCSGPIGAGRHLHMNKAFEIHRRPEVSKIRITTRIKVTSVSSYYKVPAR